MKAFEWANASSVEDAVKLLKPADGADADEVPRAMAGGQDLLTTMKDYLERPPRVVNLKTIKGLNEIKADGKGGFRIGATTTLDAIEEHAEIQAKFPGLQEAVSSVGTPQIRHMGTVGGNLCQRPRCWYFRLDSIHCRKKGGNVCYASVGENKYNAIFDTGPSSIVHPSDIATMLVALSATVSIAGPDGAKTLPIEAFFVKPDTDIRHENILKPDQLVTEVAIPATTMKTTYLKFRERESMDFAMSAVALALELNGDKTVKTIRLVLGGVASIPWRVPAAETFLVGKPLSAENIDKAATMALEGAAPLEHNGYKVPLTQALIRRALNKLNA